MRPPRLVILLSCFISLVILTTLCLRNSPSLPRASSSISTSTPPKNGLKALFSFHTPSSLFPPSAIISLTDDNSTFFLARPAAFGPSLPSKGLSGQLWVGSGFGDDSLRRGGGAPEGAEGELGCSDVPGWGEGDNNPGPVLGTDSSSIPELTNGPATDSGIKGSTGDKARRADMGADHEINGVDVDDGTDDHLHRPLLDSRPFRSAGPDQPVEHDTNAKGKNSEHADIQSLQESAEIAGKVVLLSRGGCGFLEKVKWVQRRGGIALIVGDDTRGGGLVTMYARGDTSNVTIASLFTSHTTAHLLSSLIPSNGDTAMPKVVPSAKDRTASKKKGAKKQIIKDRPTWTPSAGIAKPTSSPRLVYKSRSSQPAAEFKAKESTGWLSSFLYTIGLGRGPHPASAIGDDSRRPPSSGHFDWVINDEPGKGQILNKPEFISGNGNIADGKSSQKGQFSKGTSSSQPPNDDFVIGEQDWRDPDLVGFKAKDGSSHAVSQNSKDRGTKHDLHLTESLDKSSRDPQASSSKGKEGLQGGSITPGSGEYESSNNQKSQGAKGPGTEPSRKKLGQTTTQTNAGGWLSHLLGGDDHDESSDRQQLGLDVELPPLKQGSSRTTGSTDNDEEDLNGDEEHEGLWVTLSPTSMSTSPFFDTLLVLVVSPLVTLTVVYALLLLRSRIRRRRWRAPKSVVERLPVRTYHTMSGSSSSASSRLATPIAASPTSPLLQSNQIPTSSRSRPRSYTISAVSERPLAPASDALTAVSSTPHEKTPGRRRRYTGKQVECVICLEEYLDGHSRVMSLPCGHEFHAACITPWLTTRRRTCPICKGDVVRSLAHGTSTSSSVTASNSNRYSTYYDAPLSEDEQHIQTQAAETTNDSPTAAIPIPRSAEDVDADLERGDDSAATLLAESSDRNRMGWRNLASMSMAAFSGDTAWRQASADRDR